MYCRVYASLEEMEWNDGILQRQPEWPGEFDLMDVDGEHHPRAPYTDVAQILGLDEWSTSSKEQEREEMWSATMLQNCDIILANGELIMNSLLSSTDLDERRRLSTISEKSFSVEMNEEEPFCSGRMDQDERYRKDSSGQFTSGSGWSANLSTGVAEKVERLKESSKSKNQRERCTAK